MEQSPFGFIGASPRQKTTTENEKPNDTPSTSWFTENMNNKQRDPEKERELKELAKKFGVQSFRGENLRSQDENQNTQGYRDTYLKRSHAAAEEPKRVQQSLEERAQLLLSKPTNINYSEYPAAHPYRNPFIPCKTIDGTNTLFPRDPFIKRVRAGRLFPSRNAPQIGSRFSLQASSDSQESENNVDNNPPPSETRPPPVADNVGELQTKMAAVEVSSVKRVPVNVKTIDEINREKAAARRWTPKGDKNNNRSFKSRTFEPTFPTHAFGGFTFSNDNNTLAAGDSSAFNKPSVLPQLSIVAEGGDSSGEIPPRSTWNPVGFGFEAKPLNSNFALNTAITDKNESAFELPKDDRSSLCKLLDNKPVHQKPFQKPTGYETTGLAQNVGKPGLFNSPPARKKAFQEVDFEKRFQVGNGFESLPLVEKETPSVVTKNEVGTGSESLPVAKKETPSVVNNNETPIFLSAALRACVFCSAVKLRDIFLLDGCTNCEQFVNMKGNMEMVNKCTTSTFVGFVNIPKNNECKMFADKSPGIYAIIEEPLAEMIGEMRAEGVEYRPLSFFK